MSKDIGGIKMANSAEEIQVEETFSMDNALEKTKEEIQKPEVLEGQGVIDRISKEEKDDGTTYYRLTIGNTYYTKWINKYDNPEFIASLKKGDAIKFTWTGKVVGERTFRNIRHIERISGTTQLSDFDKKSPEEWAELRKRKIDGITFGMAMNNAAILFASMANTQDEPKKWIEENIGNPLWKAIEKKLYENYVEQRNEITGE